LVIHFVYTKTGLALKSRISG